MKTIHMLGAAMTAAVLLAVPAYAADTTPTTATTGATTADNVQLNGTLQMADGGFRTSKLVGATVYTDGGKNLGTIDDLLVGQDGKISKAILSVGTFLGLGGRLVAVDYAQLKFEPSTGQNNAMAASTVAVGNGTVGAVNNNATVAPGTTTATATPGATAPAASTAATVNSAGVAPLAPAGTGMAAADSHRMYYSVVLPGMTKEGVTAMPEFKYTHS